MRGMKRSGESYLLKLQEKSKVTQLAIRRAVQQRRWRVGKDGGGSRIRHEILVAWRVYQNV